MDKISNVSIISIHIYVDEKVHVIVLQRRVGIFRFSKINITPRVVTRSKILFYNRFFIRLQRYF